MTDQRPRIAAVFDTPKEAGISRLFLFLLVVKAILAPILTLNAINTHVGKAG
jgi:hypothetical protein